MEQLTFGACVKKGWTSAWQAITQMPWLFLGVCVVLACTSLLTAPHSDATDPSARINHALLSLLWLLLQLVVSGTLTIKVHRFVLLGEGANPLVPLHGKPLARYALIWILVAFSMLILTAVAVVAGHMVKFGVLVSVPLVLIYLFVIVRVSLLYPAVALGSPLAWRAAWRDSRGHVWSILGVGVVTYLPLFVVSGIFFFAAGPKALAAQSQHGTPVVAVIQAVLNAVFIVFAAASLSWLYRRYAQELLTRAADQPH